MHIAHLVIDIFPETLRIMIVVEPLSLKTQSLGFHAQLRIRPVANSKFGTALHNRRGPLRREVSQSRNEL